MQALIARFAKDESGATAIEYGLVAAGISVAIIAVIQGLGNNLKTAFSIYQRLRDEGYLDLRTGSGAYVSDVESVGLDQTYRQSVFELISSNLEQASRLRLTPQEYTTLVNRFVDKTKRKSARIGVVECNEEQIQLFANEIENRLRVRVIPIMLDQLERPDRRTARLLARC